MLICLFLLNNKIVYYLQNVLAFESTRSWKTYYVNWGEMCWKFHNRWVSCLVQCLLLRKYVLILGNIYSLVSKVSLEVANLTERKNLHTPVYGNVQIPQAWVWAHYIYTLVLLLPDHRDISLSKSIIPSK